MTKQSSAHSADIVIIGSGPAGYVAAIRAAQLGFSVTCIEKDSTFGGTCLNVGCIPSKALLESSHLFHNITHRASKLGIAIKDARVDIKKMMSYKDKVVADNTKGIAYLFDKHKIDSLRGHGTLTSQSGEVKVQLADGSKRSVQARKAIIIATGSEIIELSQLAAFDHHYVCHSTDALSWQTVPPSLTIVGGGVIGLELGSVWQRLGSQVTVIEAADALISSCDASLSRYMKKQLSQEGMTIHLSSRLTAVHVPKTMSHALSKHKSDDLVSVQFQDKHDKTHTITAHKVLVCVGRKPNTAGLGCEQAGIHLSQRGHIKVDPYYATSVAGVYAIGDVTEGLMLAHRAEEDGIALVEHLAGGALVKNEHLMPQVIYTWPEIASVGKTEQELKEAGIPYKTGRFSLKANARAKIMGGDSGFIRIYSHQTTDALLGVHIAAPSASELIAEITLAMNFAASSEDIARTPHAHPSLSEAIKEAALAVDLRALHG
ncbi:MAG: dihydrolipoyl dehydrogenase [Proteobacteria bacterium]|nr:dihydrolipoyl dehydrogenase [Pseudomonadota bacterium]